ncbi:hypothetical protein KF134_1246 [Lactococcus lactis subsp. lactis]|uniref:hypothetical protein n=1 Tax=Lactococcus lactis TaxID=1358 RepID=UPI00071DF22F|nr:hypothetical protein [Lactococcus lactis]KST91472.1 hypothetical protein KF134_1246 [Lactococcus lactis subsp. lactis]
MNNFLYLEFNEVKFCIYSDNIKILEKQMQLWKETLNSVYLGRGKCLEAEWVVFSEKCDEDYHFIDDSKKIVIHKYNKGSEVIETYNLIKEFIVKISLLYGYNWLHASSFRINNKTIVICGKKGFGKTTMLLRALLKKKAYFIGNDQIPIKIVNDKLYTFLWRPDIKVRGTSLELFNLNLSSDKTYIMFPQKEQLKAFDFKGYYEMTNQEVFPLFLKEIKFNKQLEEISKIIYLSDANNFLEVENIVNEILADQETVQPEDLTTWNKNKKYWNKRIVGDISSEYRNSLGKYLMSHSEIIELLFQEEREKFLNRI